MVDQGRKSTTQEKINHGFLALGAPTANGFGCGRRGFFCCCSHAFHTADGAKTPTHRERAILEKTPEVRKRAIVGEKPGVLKRAPWPEKPERSKRANVKKEPIAFKRAEVQKKPVLE